MKLLNKIKIKISWEMFCFGLEIMAWASRMESEHKRKKERVRC